MRACVCVSRLNPGQLQSDDPPDQVRNIHHPDKEMGDQDKNKKTGNVSVFKKKDFVLNLLCLDTENAQTQSYVHE